MHIEITITGGTEHARQKAGAYLRDGLKANMSATPWKIEGETRDTNNRVEDRFFYKNEGRKY